MIDSEKVKELVTKALADEGAFLVDLRIGADAKIRVLADHMKGITLEKLSKISRSVENGLDREESDFEIEVSSPGIGTPFRVKEQYAKSVGHPVKVILKNGTEIKGEVTGFEADIITLKWEERIPKPVGKGKTTVKKEEEIPLEDIKEMSLEIRFK